MHSGLGLNAQKTEQEVVSIINVDKLKFTSVKNLY